MATALKKQKDYEKNFRQVFSQTVTKQVRDWNHAKSVARDVAPVKSIRLASARAAVPLPTEPVTFRRNSLSKRKADAKEYNSDEEKMIAPVSVDNDSVSGAEAKETKTTTTVGVPTERPVRRSRQSLHYPAGREEQIGEGDCFHENNENQRKKQRKARSHN